MLILTSLSTKVKASSILQRSHEFSAKNILRDDDSSCWSSDSGSPQSISLDFGAEVTPHKVKIMFQGGFSGDFIIRSLNKLNNV